MLNLAKPTPAWRGVSTVQHKDNFKFLHLYILQTGIVFSPSTMVQAVNFLTCLWSARKRMPWGLLCFPSISRVDAGKLPWNKSQPPSFTSYPSLHALLCLQFGINIQWCVSQTQQTFIMFIIVLGQHVSILIESSSGPSKKTDPYLEMLKCFVGSQTPIFLSKDLFY